MTDDPRTLAALRPLLTQQFLLHEVAHHVLQAEHSPSQAPLAPFAHGLIDIYKCLHQGEFGVGHTIDDPEAFKQRLYQEIRRGMDQPLVQEPAIENISIDGGILRINLRALRHFYPEEADAAEDVARACIESAHITQGSPERFFATLELFRTLNQAGEIAVAGHVFAFPSAEVDRFFSDVRALMHRIRQVPVFSHSETYRRLNQPSYRVVERSVLEASPLAVLLEKQHHEK
jgi:hypothetical protein